MTAFSYQLYSSREFPPLEDTLAMLRGLGYEQVEGYGGVYGDPAALRAALDRNGLTMPSGHFGLDALENEPGKVIEIARTAGMNAVFCPHIGPDLRPDTAAGWSEFGTSTCNESFQRTMSIRSPANSSTIFLIRAPRIPTQAPTQSILLSIQDTATFER